MLVYEFKAYGKPAQFAAIDRAIRTGQFVRNKCIRYWMDRKGKNVNRFTLNHFCKDLAAEFPFAKNLNSMARQAHAERAWCAISRFYENCKKKVKGEKAENAVLGSQSGLGVSPSGGTGVSPQVEQFSKTGFPKFNDLP